MIWNLLPFFLFIYIFIPLNAQSSFYEDPDLAFTLEKVAIRQTLIPRPAIQSVNRDAIVGVVDEEMRFYSFILADQFDTLSVEEYARFMYEELPVQNKTLSYFKKEEIQGWPGVKISFSGTLQEKKILYRVDFIHCHDIMFQFVSFLIEPAKNHPDLEEIRPKFVLSKEKKPKMKKSLESTFQGGNSWYLQEDGVLVHCGWKLKALWKQEGYESKIGKSASWFHPLAFAALEREDQQANLYLCAIFGKNNLNQAVDSWKSWFQNPAALRKISQNGNQILFEMGEKDQIIVYRILGFEIHDHWIFLVEVTRKGQIFVSDSISQSIRSLGKEELEIAIRKLRSLEYQSAHVEENRSFIGNIYRDYRSGIEWGFSPSEIVDIDFETEGFDSTRQIHIENFHAGYRGIMEVSEDEFISSLEYHQKVLSSMNGVENPVTKEFKGRYYTTFRISQKKEPYLLITSKNEDLYLQVILSDVNEKEIIPLISSIRWKTLRPNYMDNRIFVSQRLGFSFEREENDQIRVTTTEELKPFAEIIEVSKGSETVEIYAICREGMNEELILDLWLSIKGLNFRLEKQSSETSSYMGVPVSQRNFTYREGKKQHYLLQKTFLRGNTLFSLIRTSMVPALNFDFLFKRKFRVDGFYQEPFSESMPASILTSTDNKNNKP